MSDKPLWLSYAVDFAQIGSAIFTAAAVLTAIWLALRNEKQRPRFNICRQITLTFIKGSHESDSEEHALSLTIVNAGVLPILVRDAHVHFQLPKDDSYGLGLGTFDPQANRSTFPLKLEHGQEVTVLVPIRKGERPWDALPSLWWLRLRPEFRVTTSLGKTFRIKPGRRLLYRLNRDVLR